MTQFRFFLVGIIAFLAWANTAWAFGVQDAIAPDPDDKPITIRIWYPTEAESNAAIKGSALPLVVISHGTGANLALHTDTAIALANAGFVVVALNHTGDNSADQSYASQRRQLVDRPRHISRVIDYMLMAWPEHGRIDPGRIGMFGHSAGGFTALVVAGGIPEMNSRHCRERPDEWACRYLRRHGAVPNDGAGPPPSAWVHDARVKAAVVAAPCCGYMFEPQGLAAINIPIQLWQAEKDILVTDSPTIIRGLLPHSPDFHLVANGGHFSFYAPCGWRMSAVSWVMERWLDLNICREADNFDRSKFQQEFNPTVVAFFTTNLPAQKR